MRTPVHVVGGFLGTGKTTVLLHELSQRQGKERCAVVVNDFGDAAVDATLLGSGVKVTNIPGGCVCCTAPEGLAPAIAAILDELRPARIFIEPSGLARPRDITDMLSRGAIADRIERMPTIVLVDPARMNQDPHLAAEQLDGADVLVANRCDLADLDQIGEFSRIANALWPRPLVIAQTSRGVLPAASFVWPDHAGPRVPREGKAENRVETPTSPDLAGGHHDHGAHEHLGHGRSADGSRSGNATPGPTENKVASTTGYVARSWVFPPSVVFAWDRLVSLLTSFPQIERFKGVFRADVGWFRLDLAGGIVHPASTAFRRDSRADLIVREGFDLEAFDTQLRAARLEDRTLNPWDAVVVTLVDPAGNEFPLSRGALSALPSQVADISALVPGRTGTGVKLREVLALAGGSRFICIANDGFTSEPLPVAEAGDAVLVHSLSGAALPTEQGGPFRLYAGKSDRCANVKALVRIRLLND